MGEDGSEIDESEVDEDFPADEEGHEGGRRGQRFPLIILAVVTLAGGLTLGLLYGLSGNSSPPPATPEGVPVQHVPDLASPDTTAAGTPVDGITCRTAADQVVRYHIHILVDVYVDGRRVRIPAGVGIPPPRTVEHFPGGVFLDNGPSGCLYWLHVHANDGVIHVESPFKATFTLGQFFDVWHQPLGPSQVGPERNPVTAFENGKRFIGNPRNIPLLPHAVIQLDVGRPVVPFVPEHFTVMGVCGAGVTSCAVGG